MRWAVAAAVLATLGGPFAAATEPAGTEEGAVDPAAAILAYTRAIESTTGPPELLAALYQSRCQMRVMTGAFDDALADCDRAVDLDPALAVAYASRGEAALGAGRLLQASADFAAAIALDPELAPLQAVRGRALVRL